MCRDWTGDHEIMADANEEYIEFLRQQAEPFPDDMIQDDGPQPVEFTDEELEEMNRVWQDAMRGCVRNGP